MPIDPEEYIEIFDEVPWEEMMAVWAIVFGIALIFINTTKQ